MSYSLCLLTATWMAAAPLPPSTGGNDQLPAATAQQAPRTTSAATPSSNTPSLRERIRNFFVPRSAETPKTPMTSTSKSSPVAPAAAQRPPQTFPAAAQQPAQTLQTVSQRSVQQPTVTPRRPNFELSKKELDSIGHEQDYSWITGKLFRVSADGGRWVLLYAGPDEVDRFEGSVMLLPHPELAKFHEGDLVCVRGQVVNGGRSPRPSAGAHYQVTEINLIQQGTR